MRIELPISKNYVSHWTVRDALRELFQNAIDREEEDNTSKMYHDVSKKDKTIRIGNRKTRLEIDSLVLGNSDKILDRDMIGKYGEGYKLALVVLLREGITVEINNQNDLWIPFFEMSELYGQTVLVINIEKNVNERFDGLEFELQNISVKDIKDYEAHNLYLRKYECIKTSTGELLLDEELKGKVFVKGLYVCDSEGDLYYGYNFNADEIPLNRDRNKVGSFDLNWSASKMIASLDDENDRIVGLIQNDRNDIKYLENFLNTVELEAIADLAYEKYRAVNPVAMPVSCNSEEDDLKKLYENIVIRHEPPELVEIMKYSARYNMDLDTFRKRSKISPNEMMIRFMDTNKKLFPDALLKRFLKLVRRSQRWRED